MNLFDSSRPLNFDDISMLYTKQDNVSPFSKCDSWPFAQNYGDSSSTAESSSSQTQPCTPIDQRSDQDNDEIQDEQLDIENLGPFGKKQYDSPTKGLKFKKKRSSENPTDRFIPSRKNSKLKSAFANPFDPEDQQKNKTKRLDQQKEDPYFSLMCLYKNIVLGYDQNKSQQSRPCEFNNNNMFRYRNPESVLTDVQNFNPNPLGDSENILSMYHKSQRKVSKVPFKVLDAPALQDDFYLNLIDWSHQNVLAVGLSSCVYLWSAHTSKVTKLCDLGITDTITSVAWSPRGSLLSVGTNSGEVQIWDSVKLKKIRVMAGHTARVGTVAWSSNILTSGSRDKNILYRDIRLSSNYVSKLTGHKQEVCGLKWSFDEQQLASGGNDNKLYIWNLHSTQPILKFSNHTAAVKALAWSPHQHGLLASGGGTADRTIRFWNTLRNTQVDCFDTGSQVCNLMFSKNVNELVSTHGYSHNQVIIWKLPTMDKLATLSGHTYRVLYLAMSPDGETIVTGAGDETLRFWNAFPSQKNTEENFASKSNLLPSNYDLR